MKALLTATVILAASASAAYAMAPVEILPEADECAMCRMAVETPRLAAELVTTGGDVRKFDEIACMADFVREHRLRPDSIRAAFVHDLESGQWMPLASARLFRSAYPTPMGGGVIAFSKADAAKRLAGKYRPTPVRWTDLTGRI